MSWPLSWPGGHSVRALVRPVTVIQGLGWPPSVERTPRDLDAAFDGIDVLVHLAAGVSGREDPQFAVTVTGTERLLEGMARTFCRRVVLASSFAVYDWSAIRGTLDEDCPIEVGPDLYERDGYSLAKSCQERITRCFAERYGWDLTVLRPGFIWGRDHSYLAALGQRVGPVQFVIGPRSHIPVTHVENCAGLFALAATDDRGPWAHAQRRRRRRAHLDILGRPPSGDGPASTADTGALLAGVRARPLRILEGLLEQCEVAAHPCTEPIRGSPETVALHEPACT